MNIVPSYKGITANNVVISATLDDKYPQNQWSIDKCDGTGPSGYNLDITKMQMIYIDFAWYGAGKVRFGIKNAQGKVYYVHEIMNANIQQMAYMRSGNLPARYEIRNNGTVFYQPYLNHWGTAVIMDGCFDEDKAYLFTGDSSILTFTNGQSGNLGANIVQGSSTFTSNVANAISIKSGYQIQANSTATTVTRGILPSTKIISAYTANDTLGNQRLYIQVDTPAIKTQNNVILTIPGYNPIYTYTPIPLLSVRLAPSVDTNISGSIGTRELINHMQMVVKSCDVTCTHESQVILYLNSDLSSTSWQPMYPPSLCQLNQHQIGDSIKYGIVLFSFRANGGGLGTATSNLARNVNSTSVDISNMVTMGNCMLAGDGCFPNGPDILTVTVVPVDTTSISATTPYSAACRLTWAEFQA
jgi:hypothetical protein